MRPRLGTSRVVVVQPTAYGRDNNVTLDGVARLGTDRARAVVVVDAKREVVKDGTIQFVAGLDVVDRDDWRRQ